MSIERFGSGGRWEQAVGYSRAVRAGQTVYVAGCTGVDEHGEVVGAGAYEQMRQACRNVEAALALAGATLADLVQTRIYVTDVARWEEIGRAHAEAFGAAPPVSAMVQVAGLIDPRMVVEVEAIAFVL
ncbi:MAG: RidA family protein [Solirubrobacterales bacterium]|nr:RidA family protein [Solirubrobacterales bacterium]